MATTTISFAIHGTKSEVAALIAQFRVACDELIPQSPGIDDNIENHIRNTVQIYLCQKHNDRLQGASQ